MTYDKYVDKVRKSADRVRWAKRHSISLGAAGAAIIGAVVVLLVCLGLFMTGVYAKDTVYGETPVYGAKAFLCRADYLFSASGSGTLTENVPRAAGEYTVTAETKNPFGKIRTSSCGFVIEKRKCVITVENAEMTYGDRTAGAEIRVTASDLAGGDSLTDIEFDMPEFADIDCTVSVKSLRIVSAGGEDMTSSYDLTFTAGNLKVLPRKLVVTASSAEREYNGLPLENPSWEITGGSVAERDKINVTVTGSITKPGKIENKIAVTLTGINGRDVTDRYDLKAIPGTLEVQKRRITVKTGGLTKEFDGISASDDEWSLVYGSLVDGDRLSAGKAPVYIRAGKYKNNIPFTVYNGSGEDVSDCYEINCKYGYIEITKRKITIATGSSEKMYDGEYMHKAEWRIVSGSLLRGHEAVVEFRFVRDAGTVENIPQYCKIYGMLDGVDSELTDCYEVTYDPGTLTVTKRPISIITGSREKYYDGTPLTCPEFTFAAGSLGLGAYDEFSFGDCAEQTEVGSCRNTFRLLLWFGNDDSTGNYDITYEYGTLTVLPSEDGQGGGSGGSGSGEGGGSGGSSGGGSAGGTQNFGSEVPKSGNDNGKGEEQPTGYFYSETGMTAYLRNLSYGDYTPFSGKWSAAPVYKGDFGERVLYLPRDVLSYISRSFSARLILLGKWNYQFMLPVQNPSGYPSNDFGIPWTGQAGKDGTYTFDMQYVEYYNLPALLDIIENSGEKVEIDPDYRDFVYENYLSVPDEHREMFSRLAYRAGIDGMTGFRLIRSVADYISTSAEYSKVYDYPADADPIIWFMMHAKKGICDHFASSAVLMYRTLGVPARRVTGYKVDAEAEIENEIVPDYGHAWVEAWMDGIGWIPVEVTAAAVGWTGEGYGGEVPYQQQEIIVDPGSAEKKYDGTPLTPSDPEVIAGRLFDGDRVVFDEAARGERTYVGETVIVQSSEPRIISRNGKDVTEYYGNIIVRTGVLRVTPNQYDDVIKMYLKDTGILPDEFSLFPELKDIAAGMKRSVTLPQKNVIVSDSKTYAFTVGEDHYLVNYDADGDGEPEYVVNVKYLVLGIDRVRIMKLTAEKAVSTGFIVIDTANRSLTMVKGEDGRDYISLIVCMEDAEKVFDGKPLSCDLVKILSGALREGDVITAKGGTYQIYAGTASNVCGGLTVRDKDGNDVTTDYIITVYAGNLKVTQAALATKESTVSVPVDETIWLDTVELSDAVKNFPATFRFVPGTGKAGVNGNALTGIEQGSGRLTVRHDPIDLNGDGIPEYLGGTLDIAVDVTAKKPSQRPRTVWLALALPVMAAGLAFVFSRHPMKIRGAARKHRRGRRGIRG